MAKIQQKHQINHFCFLHTSEYTLLATSVMELHKIVANGITPEPPFI